MKELSAACRPLTIGNRLTPGPNALLARNRGRF